MKRWDVLINLLVNRSHARGAEIGVQAGRTTGRLLTRLPGLERLYCVDLWKLYPDYEKDRVKPGDAWPSQGLLDKDEGKFRKMVFPFGMKVLTLKMDSVLAATYVEDGSLDFVFIDANHLYEYVRADIVAWLPKVRREGLLIGHDLDYPTMMHKWGVRQAVEEAFGKAFHREADYIWWVEM